MPKVSVELDGVNVRFGDSPALYRGFRADVQRTGVYAGELLGSTRMIRVEFEQASGLEAVDLEKRDRGEEPLDYLPSISDEGKARGLISSAVKTALAERQEA